MLIQSNFSVCGYIDFAGTGTGIACVRQECMKKAPCGYATDVFMACIAGNMEGHNLGSSVLHDSREPVEADITISEPSVEGISEDLLMYNMTSPWWNGISYLYVVIT